MKKLIMIVLVLATTFGYAQDRKEKMKKDWTPEQMAEKKTKKMTSELNLTDAQQARVHALYLNKANEKKAKKAAMRANNKDAKVDRKQKGMAKSNFQTQMKEVLTADQYSKWIEMKQKSKSGKHSKYKQKKQK